MSKEFIHKLENKETENSLLKWLSQNLTDFNPNAVNSSGSSALILAARNEQSKLARKLITLGADVNFSDEYGQSPLYEACCNGDLELIKALVKKNANLNYRKGFHDSLEGPLDLSMHKFLNSHTPDIKNKHLSTINYLISLATTEEKTDFFLSEIENCSQRAAFGRNIFSDATVSNIQQKLLEQKDLFKEKRQLLNQSGNEESVGKQLINKLENEESESSILKWLSQNLQDFNLDTVDMVKNSSESVLMKAARAEYSKLAKKLIALGANVNLGNKYGYSPLHEACNNGDLELVKMLIKNDANLNYKKGFHDSVEGPLDISIHKFLNSHTSETKNKYLNTVNYLVSLATTEEKTDFFLSEVENCSQRAAFGRNIFSDATVSNIRQKLLEQKDLFQEKRQLMNDLSKPAHKLAIKISV